MVIMMNRERVAKYLEIWLKYIRKEDLEELEKDINMPLVPFITDVLENLYNKYIEAIYFVPVKYDTYDSYIIAPKNGYYSLEDFLLNRLFRSVTTFIYSDESKTFRPESHYMHDFGEVLIDKDRVRNRLEEVERRRKLVAHEILHGIKTQYFSGDFFDADRYYQMKEEMKETFGREINDFGVLRNQPNDSYKHCGLRYSSGMIKKYLSQYADLDITNLDEILNESDSIAMAKDSYRTVVSLDNNVLMVLYNPESSNTFITNYAFIIERLVDQETLFTGLYIEPEIFYKSFNFMYTPLFRASYGSNLSAIEILTIQLSNIKKNPKDINLHIKLLNTLYDCIGIRYAMCGYNNGIRDKAIACIGNKGLLEVVNNRLQPLPSLRYASEYERVRNKK